MYARHVAPDAVTWSPSVIAVFGYTQPLPAMSPALSGLALPGKSPYTLQFPRVSAFGAWPLTIASSSGSSEPPSDR
jgi:hypothetical protein